MKFRALAKIVFFTRALSLVIFSARATGASIDQVKVQPDKAPDNSSLQSIIDTVTRGCKSNDEKAVAIYNYCMLTNYHLAYPSEPGGISALKEINCYGWSLCGGLHTVESALWMQAGWEHRYVGWVGHTTAEAKYDGRWHYLDVFLHFYAWEPDGKGGRTIASEDDLANKSDDLLTHAFVLDTGRNCVYAKDNQCVMNGEHANWRAPAFLSCGDTLAELIHGIKTHHVSGAADGWMGINHATGDYSTDVALLPGQSLTNRWDPTPDDWVFAQSSKPPGHTCPGHKDTRNSPAYGLILEPYISAEASRSYANGTLEFNPDFSNAAFMQSFASTDNAKYEKSTIVPSDAGRAGSVVLKLSSPYIISGKSSGLADGADRVELSLDSGKTWSLTDLDKIGSAAKGKLQAWVKVTFTHALTSLKLRVDVQNNPGALPYLSPGKNLISVSVADAKALGDNKLVVTYAYQLGSRNKSFDQLCDEGKEVARQQGATWSKTMTFAQKTFSAKDLPATFEIDCPTPKGQYPVYPRMLFMRREMIAPGSTPLPLPQEALAATPATKDELQTLPNPFLVGAEPSPPIQTRAVTTLQIPLDYVQFCNEKGEVADMGALAWPKVAAENGKVIEGAVIFNGEFKSLPPAKNVAAARLVFPVKSGHNKANEKIGAVFLKSAVEKGKAPDFKALDDLAGTTVIPVQSADMPEYQPAKPFTIDVTGAIKSIAGGQTPFHGIALRVVPDRAIDDGYTVRCWVSSTEKAYLEVDMYGQ